MVQAGETHDFTLSNIGDPDTKLGFMRPPSGQRRNQRFTIADTIKNRYWTQDEVTEGSFPLELAHVVTQAGWPGGLGARTRRDDPRLLASARYMDTGNRDGYPLLARPIETTSIGAGIHTIYVPGGIVAWDDDGHPALFTADSANSVHLARYDEKTWQSDATDTAEVRDVTLGQIQSARTSDRRIPANPVYYKGRGYCPVVGLGDNRLSESFPYLIQDAADVNVWGDAAQELGYVAFGHFTIAEDASAVKLWGGNRTYWERDGTDTPIKIKRTTTQDGVHKISSNSTPASPSAWGTDIEVGFPGSPITGLHGDADNLIIAKPEGLFRLDSAGNPVELDQSLRNLWTADNYLHSGIVGRRLILPLANGGLFELNLDTLILRDISLRNTVPDLPELHGKLMVIPTDLTSFFALVEDSDAQQYHLLKAQLIDLFGVVEWRWSHWGVVDYTSDTPSTDATDWRNLRASCWGADGHNLVFLGIPTDATTPYQVIDLLESDHHVEIDPPTSAVVATGPHVRLSRMDAGLRNVQKRWASMIVRSRHLSGTDNYLQAIARLDGGGWFFVSPNRSEAAARLEENETVLNFPPESVGYTLEVEFRPYYEGTGPAPYIESVAIQNAIRPESTQVFPMTAYLANEQEMLNEAIEYATVKERLSALRGWRDRAQEMDVEIWDEPDTGVKIRAMMLPQTYEEERLARNRVPDAEWMASFLLLRVDTEIEADTVTVSSPGAGLRGVYFTINDDGDFFSINESNDFFTLA